MSLKSCVGIVVFLAVSYGAIQVFGQATVPEGESTSLNGTVTDNKGVAIPKVEITLINLGSGWSKTITAADDGRFIIKNLGSGKYRVTAKAQGFSTKKKSITLKAGQKATLSFKLSKA